MSAFDDLPSALRSIGTRPLFVLLLAAFFAALAAATGAQLAWLLYVPPITPFMLLLRPLDQAWSPGALGALVSLLVATAGAGAWAVQSLSLTPKPFRPLRHAAEKAGRSVNYF